MDALYSDDGETGIVARQSKEHAEQKSLMIKIAIGLAFLIAASGNWPIFKAISDLWK
jgi:hypothetical protein